MKVYACPKEIPEPKYDFANYNREKEEALEVEHTKALKLWLIKAKYTGPLTGEILAIPHADGAALYMYADGAKPCLILLPYGDAWDSPHATYMPKKEVLRRISGRKALDKLFTK